MSKFRELKEDKVQKVSIGFKNKDYLCQKKFYEGVAKVTSGSHCLGLGCGGSPDMEHAVLKPGEFYANQDELVTISKAKGKKKKKKKKKIRL